MALAPVGNAKKQKWLYALSLTPIDLMRISELRQQTTDQTNLPYTGQALSYSCTGVSEQNQPSQFFYDMTSGKRQREDDEAPFKRKKQQRGPALDQGNLKIMCISKLDKNKSILFNKILYVCY